MVDLKKNRKKLIESYLCAANCCHEIGCENCDFTDSIGMCKIANPYWRYQNLYSNRQSTYEVNANNIEDELMFMPHNELVSLCRTLMLECDDKMEQQETELKKLVTDFESE